jgi:hypothetical protein
MKSEIKTDADTSLAKPRETTETFLIQSKFSILLKTKNKKS